MAEWNANQYILFEKQRTQPVIDLATRIKKCNPQSVIDVGCGPGNSTEILYEIFPQAKIIGIDSSKNMIEKAVSRYPNLNFNTCKVEELNGTYDLIFSNACLQWVPNHQLLIPTLLNKLNKNGILAVQMPFNRDEPLYKIVNQVISESKWGFQNIEIESNETLEPSIYIDILSSCSSCFDLWETKYYHILPNHQSLIDWIKSTKIRPYLSHLDLEKRMAFEKEILEKAVQAYPTTSHGNIVFCFQRLFFTAKYTCNNIGKNH